MWLCIHLAPMLCSFWVWLHFIFQMNYCMVWFHGMLTIHLIPVVRVWRMLCEHVVKVSRLARFLFIEKVTMASRFALISLSPPSAIPLRWFMCTHLNAFFLFKFFKFNFPNCSSWLFKCWNSYLFGHAEQLIYEKLPNDISERHVLLLDPILGTGTYVS